MIVVEVIRALDLTTLLLWLSNQLIAHYMCNWRAFKDFICKAGIYLVI